MPMGDSYVFHEDLTAQGKDKVVVIKTQLVIVTGNFETEGPARFHGEVVFRGGVRFRETPNGVNAGAQSGQNGIN
jgi:hypothetical protein